MQRQGLRPLLDEGHHHQRRHDRDQGRRTGRRGGVARVRTTARASPAAARSVTADRHRDPEQHDAGPRPRSRGSRRAGSPPPPGSSPTRSRSARTSRRGRRRAGRSRGCRRPSGCASRRRPRSPGRGWRSPMNGHEEPGEQSPRGRQRRVRADSRRAASSACAVMLHSGAPARAGSRDVSGDGSARISPVSGSTSSSSPALDHRIGQGTPLALDDRLPLHPREGGDPPGQIGPDGERLDVGVAHGVRVVAAGALHLAAAQAPEDDAPASPW